MSFSRYKQRIGSTVVFLTLLFNVAVMVAPRPAYAQIPTLSPDLMMAEQARELLDSAKVTLRQALVAALTSSLINLLSYMANRFAFESATWIATGGNAGSPLYNTLPTKDYLDNLAGDVVYTIYEDLVADNIQGGILPDFGVYITDNEDVLQAMRLGLRSGVQKAIPESDFPDVSRNLQGYLATLSLDDRSTPEEKTAAILTIVSEGFNPSVNEIGASLQVSLQTQQKALEQSQVGAQENLETDGFLPVTHPVTGQKLTPASFVSAELFHSLFKAKELPMNLSVGLLGNSDALLAIGASATSVFTNTLLSTLMERWRGGLFEEIADYPQHSSGYDPFNPDSSSTYDPSRIAQQFSSILSFRPLNVSDYSLLSELSTCPATIRGSQPGLFNCAMDSSFASAVARADAGVPLTLSQALEDGYIRGDWPLIPSTDTARNQDKDCFNYGFCHSNLVKMRRARIISNGWEVATESPANSETNPVTLQEVIDGFYSCNSDGELDDEHPWCHLIDPEWILKFPDTQCRTLAYGQMLKSSGTSERQEECVDVQSCVKEDAYGNCVGGYGYCVREKNTWRFRGDECPEQYASCLTFTDGEGTQVDYLTNTLDYGGCNASNQDCLWYATVKEEGDDGLFNWPIIPSVEAQDEDEDVYKERIYFNAGVEDCDEEGAGCSQVIERDADLSLNVISNGSFEVDGDGDDWPDAWILSGATYDNENDVGRTGSAAISPGSTGMFYKYGTILQQSRFYTFSFYAAQPSSAVSNSVNGYVFLADENGNQVQLSGTSYRGDCGIFDLDSDGSVYETIMIDASYASPESDAYERFECTFTTPPLSDRTLDLHAIVAFYGGDVWIDDVQLEQAEDASSYHAGYNLTNLSFDSVKLPPSYLGCTGASTDPAECANYAGICTEQDAGCTLYTPTNGDPSVTAVVSELDVCPSVCSGYDTFRQEETRYEPDGAFPVYFIPSTAQECSQEAVGCDEFTNLTTEEREYFTYLRACVTEEQAEANGTNDDAATFYTWEGSDESGYQLRTWRLLESDLDGYASVTHAASGEVDDEPGSAPCTNWQMETTTGDRIECIDDANGDGDLDADTAECDEHSDIIENPDCREFYDVDGSIHFRQWSETVTVNDICVAYRKTDTVGSDAAQQADNCEGSGGYWEGDAGYCRYFGFNEESTTCAENDAGCRAYTGGRSGNSRVALRDVFENGSLANWDAASASSVELSNESVATDGHSLRADGVSVWSFLYEESGGCATDGGCDSSGVVLGGTCTVEEGETHCGTLHDQLFTGKTYTLSFWAKGDTDLQVGFDSDFTGSPTINALFEDDAIELAAGWQSYSIGPLYMNADEHASFGNGAVLVFSPTSSGTFYIDNVVLREGEDDITVIKDSWVTPAVCDQNLTGAVSAQYHLGCQEYSDNESNTVYLRSFSKLCDEEKVGCKAYYMTNESDDPNVTVYNATCYNTDSSGASSVWTQGDQAQARTNCHLFNVSGGTAFDEDSPVLCTIIAGTNHCQFDFEDWFIPESLLRTQANIAHITYGPDATIVEADRDIYAIVTDAVRCNSADDGCQEMGKPTFSADLSAVDAWETVYLLNDPDRYSDILCSHDELFCREWDTANKGTWYFKDPGGHLCEYKTDITVNGRVYDGWFRDGTSEFCYGVGSCSDNVALACSSDADCYDPSTGIDSGSCTIDTGSYVIGGTESGIWRNGDTQYDGWVGQCEPAASGCTEFQDLLDYEDDEFYGQTDGESYYFIDNTSLDESRLLSSQKCNGQVSQKLGCALFKDTGDTGTDYNTSASYISSARADVLHGDRAFSLVDPVDCTSTATSIIITPTGDQVDLCAQRCVYSNDDLDSDFDPTVDADEVHDLVTYGGSCFDDSDCTAYDSDLGDPVSGSCETQVVDPDGVLATDAVERLENDTNRVLKVTRDRTCSEWLACSSSYTVWDEDAGKYRTICDDIDLCTAYGGSSSASLCSSWDPDDPAVVLDIDRYVARDVSWYGEEYSGYAVPEIFPIQHLSQVNIAPPVGICDMSSSYSAGDSPYDTYHGEACDDDVDCGRATGSGEFEYCVNESKEDFQLGYSAGSCGENHGEDCVVGYCEASGSACSDDDDCEDADDSCITGMCYTVSTTTCESDDDCGSGSTCLTGSCVAETGTCDTNFACADAASTCFSSAAAKVGSCYSGSCFLSINGSPFNNETTEGMVCRAQPEIDSPFPTDIVSSWKYLKFGSTVAEEIEDPGQELTLDQVGSSIGYIVSSSTNVGTDNVYGGTLPSQMKSGFDGANACATGEDCECSYYSLGTQAGGSSQYIDYATLSSTGVTGICSADSPVAGALCGDHDDCRYYDSTKAGYGTSINDGYVGTCDPITSEQLYIGLEGYCLERDTGLNINGDPDLGACLTWLPVDQIAGATDVYAKYRSAGYFNDTYVCSNTRPTVNLHTSKIAGDSHYSNVYEGTDIGIACAEADGGIDKGNSYNKLVGLDGHSGCYERATCPDGYFAIIGQAAPGKGASWSGGGYAQDCAEDLGDNDCPYVCVPINSVHENDPTMACEPPTSSGTGGSVSQKEANAGNPVYTWAKSALSSGSDVDWVPHLAAFNDVVDAYQDCVLKGVDLEEVEDSVVDYGYSSSGTGLSDSCGGSSSGSGAGGGYRCLYIHWEVVPACGELIQVASDIESYAFTNTLYQGSVGGNVAFDYDNDTLPTFGFSSVIPSNVSGNQPIRVAACTNAAVSDMASIVTSADLFTDAARNYLEYPESINSCSENDIANTPLDVEGDGAQDPTPPGSPEARSFIQFEWTGVYSGPYDWNIESGGKTTLFERVNNLFAKLKIEGNTIFTWNDDDWDNEDADGVADLFSYVATPWGDVDSYESDYADQIDVRAIMGTSPTVWAVDTRNCGPRYCGEGEENALTLNNANEGDVEADGGYYRGNLKFFAAADKNQLPIRRVIVDWGDASTSGSADDSNYYKNHRGLQNEEDGVEETQTLSKCSLEDEWGLTAASCDPNYFNYSHVYRCWDPTELPTCLESDDGNLLNSPCTFDQLSCVFQPRVHVRDNWGWCTGECSGDECFDESPLNSPGPNNECNYSKYPDVDENKDPWVYYDGYIYVEP